MEIGPQPGREKLIGPPQEPTKQITEGSPRGPGEGPCVKRGMMVPEAEADYSRPLVEWGLMLNVFDKEWVLD